MASQQSSVEISQFTAENLTIDSNRDETSTWADEVEDSEKPATPVEVPEALRNLSKKGVQFQEVHFWGIHEEKPKLVKNQSIYFSVDTVIKSQEILEAFDRAGIDSGEIIAVQRKASNNSWVVTFDSPVTKEAAVEIANVEIDGVTVFLGDCEHRLVLVKMYEAPEELPDTALIGRLAHWHNGVRTARMELHRHIPSIINLVGEVVRIWYPKQPKTCRNCGSKDHLVKNCSSVRCLNCEQSGHRADECPEADMCGVCKGFSHSMADCPYVLFSANVAAKVKPTSESKSDGEEKQCEKVDRETLKAERENRKIEHRKKQQHLQQQQKKSHQERGEKGRGQRGDQQVQRSRDEPPCVRSRDETSREGPVKIGHATIVDRVWIEIEVKCQMVKTEDGMIAMKSEEKESGKRDIVITGDTLRGIVLRAMNRVILTVMMMMGITDGLLCHPDVDAGMMMISIDE